MLLPIIEQLLVYLSRYWPHADQKHDETDACDCTHEGGSLFEEGEAILGRSSSVMVETQRNIPPSTELTIDGTVQRATASVAGLPTQPASNLLYGTDGTPMTWPSLSCGVPYVMTIDTPTNAPNDLSVSLSLTRQE